MTLEFINRRNTNCYKWDSPCAKDMLPLWVADMDFKAAQPIINAMQKRLDHGVFGYQHVPQEYYDTIASWFSRKHGWNTITREKIIYTTGVVPAIAAILRALRIKNNNQPLRIITLTPAYNCFFSCIDNLECQLIPLPLNYQNCYFTIDFNALENIAQQADVFLLCNPHNPTGRVWTNEELNQIAKICHKNNLFVISDEIHCEFTFPNHQYTPFANVAKDNNYCICTSASKAFNIAGLQCANIFVPDPEYYSFIDKAVNIHEICDINPFGMVAQMAAYNESEEWLDELNKYVYSNYQLLKIFIEIHMPKLILTKMEGTYLAWVNINAINTTSELFCQQLAEQQHVLFNPSEMYGAQHFIRINLATSNEILSEALTRLLLFYKRNSQ